MLGKTHVMTGIAASLIITQPSSMVELVSSISGGAIGGWLCDIDCREVSGEEGAIQGLLLTGFVGSICVFIDKILGGGAYEYAISHWGVPSIIAVLFFSAVCIIGFFSSHRTFTHSILATLLISSAVFVFCRPIAVPILVGLSSHIILDLFNRRDLKVFFPLDTGICFNICDSDGKANQVIMFCSTILAAILSGSFFVSNLPSVNNPLNGSVLEQLPWLSSFTWYLIIINIITL